MHKLTPLPTFFVADEVLDTAVKPSFAPLTLTVIFAPRSSAVSV